MFVEDTKKEKQWHMLCVCCPDMSETPFFFFALPDLFIEGLLFSSFRCQRSSEICSAHLEESDGPGFDLADDPGWPLHWVTLVTLVTRCNVWRINSAHERDTQSFWWIKKVGSGKLMAAPISLMHPRRLAIPFSKLRRPVFSIALGLFYRSIIMLLWRAGVWNLPGGTKIWTNWYFIDASDLLRRSPLQLPDAKISEPLYFNFSLEIFCT